MLPLVAFLASTAAGAAADFAYVRTVPHGPRLVVVDTRPLDECRKQSLAGARCLPASDFLGPQRRLPDARNLLWLLGTAGLIGDEEVLVVGQDVAARDFVAGLLHVAGQRSVRVLTETVAHVVARGADASAGRERALVRETVYTAPMRDDRLVLRDELTALPSYPMLLDGRSDAEYWGETARVARTGHLPGAINLPAVQLRAALDPAAARPALPEPSRVPPVAYAHDAYEGFSYLTLLVAGHDVPARLYAEGWAEWAASGLPADAVGYPEPERKTADRDLTPSPIASSQATLLIGALALVLAAFALGWRLARRRCA